MFVAFEGIDGSGKTTLSNLVAQRLREAGRDVLHAREKGVLATAVARRVRELTRDTALLEMCPRAELFLNVAREAQQLAQVVRPAVAAGKVVIADRSLHSLVALAAAGRALPRAEIDAVVAVAADGLRPDVVVLVDVDPDLARLRKRVGKILDGRDRDAESRKGLAGAGLQVRIREHLRAEATADPARWIVARNEGTPLAALADEVAAEIARRLAGPAPVRRAPPRRNVAVRAPEPSPRAVAARFHAMVASIAATEPALAASLLTGIPGEEEHALRVALAPRAPRLVARSLRELRDPGSEALRRSLAPGFPADVADGLGVDPAPEAMALRAELVDAAPVPVAAGLAGNDAPEAWALRRRALELGALGAVLEGLAGLDGDGAWALREEGMRRALWGPVGQSLSHVAGERADALRAALAQRDPLAALRATEGIDGEGARALRERFFPFAPKRVLRALVGVDAPYAWALRERALAQTKEALDSVDGMDDARAWALREAGVSRWPATAVSSLWALAPSPRGRALVARALRAAPEGVVTLRNAHAAFARAAAGLSRAAPRARPAGAREFPAHAMEETCSI